MAPLNHKNDWTFEMGISSNWMDFGPKMRKINIPSIIKTDPTPAMDNSLNSE